MQQTIETQFVSSAVQFEVKPLRPFGAEIAGFSFDRKLNVDSLRALRKALIEHKMLLIRDQHFSPAEQIAFTKLFGHELLRTGPSLRFLPEYPELFQITNRPGTGNSNTGQYWHSDGHYLADPSPVSVMHIVNATRDGATLVTDTVAAFDALGEKAKLFLASHGFVVSETGVGHPIVRKHPLTGQLTLYVNLRASPVDRDLHAVPIISELIEAHLARPGTFYEHHWQDGDTLVVDNFSTAHRGTASDPRNLRVMHRTSVIGNSVWWRAQQEQALN